MDEKQLMAAIAEAAAQGDAEKVTNLSRDLAKVRKEAEVKATEAQKAEREALQNAVQSALKAIRLPKGFQLQGKVRRTETGLDELASVAVTNPNLPDMVWAALGDVLNGAPSSVKGVTFDINEEGVTVSFGSTPSKGGSGGTGGGKAASLTVDGVEYPSAAAAYKAVLGDMKAPMNRKSIVSHLKTAGHTVSE